MRSLGSLLVVFLFAVLVVGCGYAPVVESDPPGGIVSVNGGNNWPAPTPTNVAIPVDASTKSFKITVWKAGYLPETKTVQREGTTDDSWPQRLSFKLRPDPNVAGSGQEKKPDPGPAPRADPAPPPKPDPKPTSDAPRRFCTGCKASLDPDAPFCPKCGLKQPGAQPQMKDCPVCGEKRPIGPGECPHCGVK
ncbi:hypothetical protein HY251_01235 [bacterium]|nr:hypothetical protein [bacterium]